ncbi:MAG: ACP S-malonyltransferase [Spirochaetia bacterium]|nr:ACP S-malonyltransferase [Spirochaetia bacterium]
MSLVLVFPGQGAQYVGMGFDFCEGNERANAIFAIAEHTFGGGLKEAMFLGPEETLKKTDYTQPAIFTMSCAIYEAVKEMFAGRVAYTAGHSLGEYSALYAAGAFDFESGFKLVKRRGALMQEASSVNKGSMAAVLNLDDDKIAELCQKASSAGYIAAANFNSPGQVVVSGDTAAIDAGEAIAGELGARRYIKLAVAGAFHSKHMQSAADGLKAEIDGFDIRDAAIPVVSNFLAKDVKTADEIKNALVNQITGSVLWADSIRYMISNGADTFVEIGPGTALSGMIKKIDRNVKVFNIDKVADIEKITI